MGHGGGLTKPKVLAIWLAIGSGAGVIGGLQLYVATDGNVLRSLAGVGLGVLVGLVTGLLYTLVHRKDFSTHQGFPMWQRLLFLLAVVALSTAAGFVRALDGPVLLEWLLLAFGAIVLIIIMLRMRGTKS